MEPVGLLIQLSVCWSETTVVFYYEAALTVDLLEHVLLVMEDVTKNTEVVSF